MSGSGTTMFALCRNQEEAQNLAERLKEQNLGVTFAMSSSKSTSLERKKT